MLDTILKLGGLQALLVGVFLFRSKVKNPANGLLSFLMFTLGLSCLFYSFNSLEFYLKFPHLIRIDWGIPLLYAPLLYLYIRSITESIVISKNDSIHFIPYLINIVILLPFFLGSGEEKVQILDYFTESITTGTDLYRFYSFLLDLAIVFVGAFYVIKSLRIVNKYKEALLNEFSSEEKFKINWLYILLYAFIFLLTISLIVLIVIFGDRYPQFDYKLYYFIYVFLLTYAMSYKALSQPKIMSLGELRTISSVKDNTINVTKRGDKAFIIENFMTDQKPYLNNNLTATELAGLLGISRHELSRVLNEEIGKNFYDFINYYRLEEFKYRLALPENENITLLGIAYDSGFNSKTTFNTIFKRYTGLTPSQYKSKIK